LKTKWEHLAFVVWLVFLGLLRSVQGLHVGSRNPTALRLAQAEPPTWWDRGSSDPQTLRHSDPQSLKPSDSQTLRPSDTQTLRPSDPQTLKPSNPQTLNILLMFASCCSKLIKFPPDLNIQTRDSLWPLWPLWRWCSRLDFFSPFWFFSTISNRSPARRSISCLDVLVKSAITRYVSNRMGPEISEKVKTKKYSGKTNFLQEEQKLQLKLLSRCRNTLKKH